MPANRPPLRSLHTSFSLLILLAALALGGCAGVPRPAVTPMATRWSTSLATDGKNPVVAAAEAPRTADTLIVFLPGRADRMEDFERRGFVAALHTAGVRADWIAVDAHLGYFWKRTVVERLVADVVQPARARGYCRVVAVGISLGGLGALLTERDQPGSFDALVLLAPYLGDDATVRRAIATAGGPAAWAQGRAPDAGSIDEKLWTFLGQRAAALPPTWLAFGAGDAFAPAHRQLAPLLPPARVLERPGAHDWAAWTKLWQELVAQPELFRTERTGDPHSP